jgi:diguanylate cyclase (GGDEF)-like protein
VASRSSADSPGKTNGTLGRQHEDNTASSGFGDEQTLADGEQTLADTDQTLGDADQTSAERDQSGADRDQVASDRDQAASDRDLADGVNADQHQASREIRRRSALQRGQTAAIRLASARERDATAHARDVAGLARDRAAAARDLAMAQRDRGSQFDSARAVTGAEIVMRAAEQRRRAAQYRAQAAEHRDQAALDREAAAEDREQAARDRLQALADCEALARALAVTEIDPLTGARARAAGLADLNHEVDRCHRTGGTLVVAYVDAVGLKLVNDTGGQDAGDRLLRRLVALIREHVRSYDLIIRLGGDEFLCAMERMSLRDSRARFSEIASALAGSSEAGAIRFGFAELTADETAAELVARADRELVDSRPTDGRRHVRVTGG